MLKNIQNNIISHLDGQTASEVLPTANEFSLAVEIRASFTHGTLLDSLTELVEELKLDTIDVPKLLTRALKEKLGIEQVIIKPEPKLPI